MFFGLYKIRKENETMISRRNKNFFWFKQDQYIYISKKVTVHSYLRWIIYIYIDLREAKIQITLHAIETD